jgi:hypothetical protein
MPVRKAHKKIRGRKNSEPLWEMDIAEVTGHNLETRGREEVNRLLEAGWRLLHIYTLKYQEDGTWRERPMAILGKLRDRQLDSPLSKQPLKKVGA